jgi:hypothetical protein
MMWIFSGIITFAILVIVYLRYKATSHAGVVDPSEVQEAYWRATKRLGLFVVLLFVLYLFAVLVLRRAPL